MTHMTRTFMTFAFAAKFCMVDLDCNATATTILYYIILLNQQPHYIIDVTLD